MTTIEFSDSEKEAFRAAGEPVPGDQSLSILQQNEVRLHWSSYLPDRTGPVPSMKGMTVSQAKALYHHWGIKDMTILGSSSKAITGATAIVAFIAIVIVVAIAWFARPVGFYILGFILAFTAFSRLLGYFNDKDIRFNDLRQRVFSENSL